MTERKPAEMNFTSWIDKQISEATERGAFDNLPGAGQPLPRREEDAGQAWLRDYLRREGVAGEELLPEPLKLRKEIERLAETVAGLRSEQEVRDIAAGINRRIVEWRRIPLGPPVFLPLVDTEAMVSRWRDGQAVTPPPSQVGGGEPSSEIKPARPRRWYQLRRRPGR